MFIEKEAVKEHTMLLQGALGATKHTAAYISIGMLL